MKTHQNRKLNQIDETSEFVSMGSRQVALAQDSKNLENRKGNQFTVAWIQI